MLQKTVFFPVTDDQLCNAKNKTPAGIIPPGLLIFIIYKEVN